MVNKMLSVFDKEYVDGGTWKCEDSPSGAHHWMIKKAKSGKDMKCKHCLKIRHLDEDIAFPIYGKKSKR